MVIRVSQDYKGAAQVSYCWPQGGRTASWSRTWAGLGSREHLGCKPGAPGRGPLCGRGSGFGRFVSSVSAEGGYLTEACEIAGSRCKCQGMGGGGQFMA